MRVYKFRSIKLDEEFKHVLNMISLGECYFSPPSQLNDPFEYLAKPQYNKQSFEERLRFWVQVPAFAPTLRGLSKDEQMRWIEETEKIYPMIPEVLYQNGTQGIFCTCMTWDNRVLWSLYADNNLGVAVEIETDGVEILASSLTEVQYEDKVPELDYYGGCGIGDLSRVCATKHEDWRHEREVRFFCNSGVHRIPVKKIVGLYLGAGCRSAYPKKANELIRALRTANSEAKVWDMICDRRSGKLQKVLGS